MMGRFLFSSSVQVVEAYLLLNPLTTFYGMEIVLLLTPALSVMIVQPCGILLHYSTTNKQPLLIPIFQS